MMIFLDTETTGLLKPAAIRTIEQPFIIELYACKVDKDFKFIGEIETFIKPPVPISEEITKITGIDESMVKDAPTFIEVYKDLVDFFLGEETLIAHNAPFDVGVLYWELFRADKEKHFPWPHRHVCTVERTMPMENRRLPLAKLHEKLLGKPHENAHRAKDDVHALIRCYIQLKEMGYVEAY
jgi:DNA polymerase-3 subunit alpha (Gram-positive type)